MRGILASEVLMPTDDKTMVHVQMENSLVGRLDDFRFSKRFPSRSAAMKYLLNWALERSPEPAPEELRRWG